jgi:cytochrome c biogenesis protein CcmG/thiol:disulfide interchange protein DsbE
MKLNKWYIAAAFLVIAIGVGYQYLTANGTNNQAQSKDTQEISYSQAPDFVLTDIKGNGVKLSDYKGKVVIVDFWATWCGPCRMGIPDFVALQSEYGEDDLIILGISVDQGDLSVVPAFAKEYNINYPVLFATMEVVSAYGGIRSIPTTFIIDREGKVRNRIIGYQPKAFFKGEVDKLL